MRQIATALKATDNGLTCQQISTQPKGSAGLCTAAKGDCEVLRRQAQCAPPRAGNYLTTKLVGVGDEFDGQTPQCLENASKMSISNGI